jgi:hypothetical protein
VKAQIKGAQDAGAVGWLLWSPGNHYEEAYRAMEDMAGKEKAGAMNTTPAKQ